MNVGEAFSELFAPEEPAASSSIVASDRAWKVLLVDDEPDMHAVLHLAMRDVQVEGRPLCLLDASSASQALELLREHPDTALVLLDVVMESERAGLDLVGSIRQQLGYGMTQIVVLTGQPGRAPQRSVIADYRIDGYRLKSELSSDLIYVTVYAAIRSYQALRALEEQRVALQALSETLCEREERLRAVVESTPDAILLGDARGVITGWNTGAERLFGYRRDEILGSSFLRLAPPEQSELAYAAFIALRSGLSPELQPGLPIETIAVRQDQTELPVEFVLGSWESGGERNYSVIVRDIRQRKLTEEKLRLAANVYANCFEGLIIADAGRRIVDVNPAFTRISGYERDEVLGQSPLILFSRELSENSLEEMKHAVREKDFWMGEVSSRRKNGEFFPELLTVSVIRDDLGEITHYIGVITDVTQIKQHERELIRVANYDSLTGLPNRRLLAERLMQSMAQCRRTGRCMVLCYLDLDGFKQINDELGHAAGDQLLIEVARRLKSVLRAGDTLARLGGDEFVLLLVELVSQDACRGVLDRLLHKLKTPLYLGGRTVSVTASIGVSSYPADEANADTLLRQGDQAMYQAKENGKNGYCFFDARHARERDHSRLHVERIGQALHRRELTLYYQPKVDLLDGRVHGVEALIRWRHPESGLLLPAEFLHYVDQLPLEIEIGEWVLREVMAQICAWKQQGLNLVVSANVGANHLMQPDFICRLGNLLKEYPAVRPGDLELEILESSGLTDIRAAVETLNRCRKLGVRIALDDFGSGYSSLIYFLKLPIQTLKVDQSFVRGMGDDPNELGMVESMVRLAQAFNHPVIAEGVETPEHGAMLLALGCRLVQGFGVASPMPADELPAWVQQWTRQQSWLSLPRQPFDQNILLAVVRRSIAKWTEELIAMHHHPGSFPDVKMETGDCAFCRWYAGNGSVRYGTAPGYAQIGQLHEYSHELAHALLKTPPHSLEAAQLVEQLIHARDQLDEGLQTLLEGAQMTPCAQSMSLWSGQTMPLPAL